MLKLPSLSVTAGFCRHRIGLFGLLVSMLALKPLAAASVWHVTSGGGEAAQDGRSAASAFSSIQQAADMAGPGDEVVVHPGVYFGSVALKCRGTPEAPVIFRADAIAKNRVVMSGSSPALRRKESTWKLEDAALSLYSTSFAERATDRVLYSGTDLYPYASLDQLKSFRTVLAPGPRHGYWHDVNAGRLYVRLHASGRHGAADPAQHDMAAGPTEGFGITIPRKGPAHLVIQGITFETSGDSAVFTEASCVTVRDCWFFGTPYAVRGTNKGRAQEQGAAPYDTASEIVIEHCEYTEGSPFEDACDLLSDRIKNTPGAKAEWTDIWHRKTTGEYGLPADKKNYETGIAVRIGRGWRLRHNHIHDCFEGLANDGMSLSLDTWIHDNVFARICDNAVETESHARDAHIYRNVFLDVMETFSCQPLDGPPWPGPLWFYQNIISSTPRMQALWSATPNDARGVFKIGISHKNWRDGKNADVSKTHLAAPAPGLLFFNNTVFHPGGRLFTLLGDRNVPVGNVTFANNLIATGFIAATTAENDMRPGHFQFLNNHIASTAAASAAFSIVSGEGGQVLSTIDQLGWTDPGKQDFRPAQDAPALPPSVTRPGLEPRLPHLGALQPGDTWNAARPGPRTTVPESRPQ